MLLVLCLAGSCSAGPARVGPVAVDLAFTVVFVAAVVLRALVSSL